VASGFDNLSDDQLIDRLRADAERSGGRQPTLPRFPVASVRRAARPNRPACSPVSTLEQLFAVAHAMVKGGRGGASTMIAKIAREISAGGDPLGDYYTLLRPVEARRDTGMTLTPLGLVDGMMRRAARNLGEPTRIVDPGAGTGRFAIAAARMFPAARIVAVENDPDLALLLRANLSALGLIGRIRVLVSDFRKIDLPAISEPTLFIGNPPYVRHHNIRPEWKDWYAAACARHGVTASRLAGLHMHFFAKVAEIGREGDHGWFITAAEWLDVGYGAALRTLLSKWLGGYELEVLEPTAEAFPGTMTTAAITAFQIGRRPESLRVHSTSKPADLARSTHCTPIGWDRVARTPRWTLLIRDDPPPPPGAIELGELCRVHRGQVTGANHIWIAGAHSRGLPGIVLKPTVTAAAEIIAAGAVMDDDKRLARVIDLPADLSTLGLEDRRAVERFIKWAKDAGAAEGYVARHRTPWWAVRLGEPAPIVCTYMGRRPPAFVRNRAGARLLNIAHGIYPRESMSEDSLIRLVGILRATVSQSAGRTYSGGLTKFEPRELERVHLQWEKAVG
jgi:predicted RNA methylase